MSIPVFDKCNKLHHLRVRDISSVYKEDYSRRNIVLVGDDEYYLPHTIDQINILMSPLGFYQVNQSQIINTTRIDNYDFGVITIDERRYYLSRRRVSEFEGLYLPD